MNYTLNYEKLDEHWIVGLEGKTVMRFPTKQQAASYIDARLKIHIQKEIKEVKKNMKTGDSSEK